jgi:hypothetical protein
MRGMGDDLRALGEIVTDRHLVLNLLQSLNKRFYHMKIFIKRSQSFPSFHTVNNDLELEERLPRDRPPCSTPHPQEDGVLHNSSCLCAYHSRNYSVLKWPIPLLPHPQQW